MMRPSLGWIPKQPGKFLDAVHEMVGLLCQRIENLPGTCDEHGPETGSTGDVPSMCGNHHGVTSFIIDLLKRPPINVQIWLEFMDRFCNPRPGNFRTVAKRAHELN